MISNSRLGERLPASEVPPDCAAPFGTEVGSAQPARTTWTADARIKQDACRIDAPTLKRGDRTAPLRGSSSGGWTGRQARDTRGYRYCQSGEGGRCSSHRSRRTSNAISVSYLRASSCPKHL